MSRCGVCDKRLNDYEYRAGKDTCGYCQEVIDLSLAEEDYSYDKEFTFEDEEEGVKTEAHSLDYYDNIDGFDEADEEDFSV